MIVGAGVAEGNKDSLPKSLSTIQHWGYFWNPGDIRW